MTRGKTGGGNTEWVEYDSPKPPAVPEHERYGNVGQAVPYHVGPNPDDKLSERAKWWLRQIERGWRPNKRNLNCCWDCNTEWLGVRGWEYMEYIQPALRPPVPPPPPVYGPPTFAEFFAAGIKADLDKALTDELDRMLLWGDGTGDLRGIT
jgi:hypothetical protein